MGLVNHLPYYQDLGTFEELERRQEYEPMNQEGFNYWWERMCNRLCRSLLDQLLILDQDDKPYEGRHLFNAKVIIPLSMREFINKENSPNDFIRKQVESFLNQRIKTILVDQVLMANDTTCLIFLVLKGIVKKDILDYNLVGVQLSGSQRKEYPKLDKDPRQGGASYEKDLYPNMPESNTKTCKWGVYWRRLKESGEPFIDA